MIPPPQAAGYVLAGGLSARMGKNKALLELGGRPLIEHALGILHAVGLPAAIAGGVPELARFAPLLADAAPHLGPLNGIATALNHCPTPYAVFLPVDLPFFPPDALQALLQFACTQQAAVALYARDNFLESFPVVLCRQALPYLLRQLATEQRSCIAGYQTAATALGQPIYSLPLPEDQAQAWMTNLNHPEEFAHAQQRLRGPIA